MVKYEGMHGNDNKFRIVITSRREREGFVQGGKKGASTCNDIFLRVTGT